MKARACTLWLAMLPTLAACAGDDRAHAETIGTATPVASAVTTAVVVAVQIPEVDPCRDAPSCTYQGRCRYVEEGAREGECVAESNEDCRASQGCLDWGRCSLSDESGRCVAAEKEDCRESWHCRVQGRCTPKHGRCVVGGDEDCRRSERCKYSRQCEARGKRCVR